MLKIDQHQDLSNRVLLYFHIIQAWDGCTHVNTALPSCKELVLSTSINNRH